MSSLSPAMADLYSLVHAEAGPLTTFTSSEESEEELRRIIEDEPGMGRRRVDRAVQPRRHTDRTQLTEERATSRFAAGDDGDLELPGVAAQRALPLVSLD